MSKITLYSIAFTVVLIPAMAFAQAAPSTGDSVSSAVVVAPSDPSTGDSVSSASVSAPSTPSTGDSVSSAGNSTPSAPSTGDSVSSAGSSAPSAPSTGDSVSSAGPASAPVTPTTPSGGSTSSSGSYVGFSSGGSSIVPLASSATTTTTCPLLTSYLQFGSNNDSSQVAKLQAFLKDSQGQNVTVNGIFDLQTENAVRAFQSKYLSEVMGPWGATQSSGYVYITTLKKVNEIACNTPLTLSPSEMAVINAYKDQQNQNGSAVGTSTNATTTPLIPLIGQNSTGAAALVATVGSFASAWNNFWGSVWKGITKIF